MYYVNSKPIYSVICHTCERKKWEKILDAILS